MAIKVSDNSYPFAPLSGGYIHNEEEGILTPIADYRAIEYGKGIIDDNEIPTLVEIMILWNKKDFYENLKEQVEEQLRKLGARNHWQIGVRHYFPVLDLKIL